MSNYASLKATINANIKTNGNQEITGSILNSVLNAMTNSLGAGYQFMGVATPSTNPGSPDYKVFYIATTPGTYTNFNGLVVADGEVVVFRWDSSWHKDVTGVASEKLVSQAQLDIIPLNHFSYSSKDTNYRIKLDGDIAGTSVCDVYRINNIPGYVRRIKVNASLKSDSLVISFYNSNSLSSSNLISGIPGRALDNEYLAYLADVPANTKMICITHAKTYVSAPEIYVDDGGYIQKSLALAFSNVKQTFGDSTLDVVSQDAITKYLLDSIITEVSDSPVALDVSKYNVVRGIVNANGQLVSDSSRVINSEPMDIRGLAYFSVTLPSGCKYNIAYYATPEESSFIAMENSTWIDVSGEYRTKGCYMRIQAMGATSPTAMDIFDSFTILGYSRKIGAQVLNDKIAASDYDGDVYPVNYTFVQGTLINGILTQNYSFICSKDFINVGGLRSIKVINDIGFKSAVVLYDDNKNFVIGMPPVSESSYLVDVGGYKYIKMVIGKTNGGQIKDGETHITIIGNKERTYNIIDVSHLYYAGSLVNGAIQDAVSRISTKQFIDIRNLDTLCVNVASGYYYCVVYYASNSEGAYIGGTSWSNISASLDVSKYQYARITIRRSDNGSMAVSEGSNVSLYGYLPKTSSDNRTYNGARISLKQRMSYKSVWDKFSMLFNSAYSFDQETQQGSAIHNGYLFMLRHHAVVDVVNLNTMSFVNEFVISAISEQKPHCNSGSFSKQFPSGNSNFPYLYTGRCSYPDDSVGESDAMRNCCYVLNITTTGATLAQTITFANDHGDFYTTENGGAWDWLLDTERNLLYVIGYGGNPRKYIVKVFNAPNPSIGGTVALTDSDVIEQWDIPDNFINEQHAFQGATIYGNYFILPVSRGDSLVQSEAIRIFDKYNHQEISNFELVESEVGEAQSVSVWNGLLWIVSKDGRLDLVNFDD